MTTDKAEALADLLELTVQAVSGPVHRAAWEDADGKATQAFIDSLRGGGLGAVDLAGFQSQS